MNLNALNVEARGTREPIESRPIERELYALMATLFPICRSLTGAGQRKTLAILRDYIDLTIHEVPSGTQVFDWVIPKEWNIRNAYIKDPSGKKVVDFAKSNLHVVNYSAPVRQRIPFAELKKHLFTAPEHPHWIPYRTSYYEENWGFCLSHRQFLEMQEGEYEVLIDSSLKNGSLTYGEYYLAGEREDEILISCHICHPSLANDNLTGIAIATVLANKLSHVSRRYSYRFLFIPGQIGSLAWLCKNESRLSRIRGGLILACLGDSGHFTYKKSRRGDAEIDRAVSKVLKDAGEAYDSVDFAPYGYDERQFCSPGFNLPVGCLMRTPYGRFPEYHTSADNLSFVRSERVAESFARCWAVIQLLERNRVLTNLNPKGEPQLGKRGLYGAIGGQSGGKSQELAMLWVLNFADGSNSLLDIAERSGMPFDTIFQAAETLRHHALLKAQP
jgi:aminopeptidase-like protein